MCPAGAFLVAKEAEQTTHARPPSQVGRLQNAFPRRGGAHLGTSKARHIEPTGSGGAGCPDQRHAMSPGKVERQAGNGPPRQDIPGGLGRDPQAEDSGK